MHYYVFLEESDAPMAQESTLERAVAQGVRMFGDEGWFVMQGDEHSLQMCDPSLVVELMHKALLGV